MTDYTDLAVRVDAIEDQLANIIKTQGEHTEVLAVGIQRTDELRESTNKQFAAVKADMKAHFTAVDTRLDNIERLLVIIAEAVKKGSPPSSNA